MPANAMPPAPAPKKRDATQTRAAILASGRAAFARLGYDGAGVREIAAGAGVTAMLVNRYFGSKEGLFAEVIADTMATTGVVLPQILKQPMSSEDIAATLVGITQAGAAPLVGFQIMMRSVASDRAAQIAREQIQKHQQARIVETLGGQHTEQRAALLLSLIAGFQMMRQMIGLSALAECPPETLTRLLAPMIQDLLAGDAVAATPEPAARAKAESTRSPR